ncbi:hypothetical protein [Longirhabdus pacifica]|uniref:hypothetical protein n=1 Tax=Longirhabdus pacifica TaxID=2305227 RepID=UPI0010088A81|nr:hypothetical protein [Longirhabdus pacifica]
MSENKKATITYRLNNVHEPSSVQASDLSVEEEIKKQRDEKKLVESNHIQHNQNEAIQDPLLDAKNKQLPTEEKGSDEFKKIVDTQPLNQFTTDFGAWQSPYEEELHRIEQIIRETDQQQYEKLEQVKQRNEYETYRGPIISEEVLKGEVSYHNHNIKAPPSSIRYKKTKKTSWLKVTGAVSSGVISGVFLGYVVLSFFSSTEPLTILPGNSGEETEAQSNGETSNLETPFPIPMGNENTASLQDEGNAEDTTSLSNLLVADPLNTDTYYVLQHGVFSSLQSAQAAMQQLTNEGFASVIDMQLQNQYFVFTAATQSEEDAGLLSNVLNEAGFETYIKSVQIPQFQTASSDSLSQVTESYFTEGDKLVRMLSGISAVQLQEDTAALEKQTIDAIKVQYQSWNNAAAQLVNTGEVLNSTFEVMNSALQRSMTAMEGYEKDPSPSYLWQIQSAILQYIITKKNI